MNKWIAVTFLITALTSTVALADDVEAGDFMIRGRALGVVPQESSTVNIGGFVGGEAKVDNSVVPEVDFTYFFTPNIAVEAIAAITPHKVKAVNTAAGPEVDIGKAWLLPPTVTLQYHFTQFQSFKPYLGAGINYTHFFNEKPGALSSVTYEDSWGGALQAGVDIHLQDHWYLNADVKKVFINTKAEFNGGAVQGDVDIDPWLVGVGLAYRF